MLNKILIPIVLLAGILLGLILHQRLIQPVYRLPDGGVYRGELVEGVLQGEGSIKWGNGERYEGQFLDGQYSGRGRFTATDGSFYRGEFLNGRFHGQGEQRFADGAHYVGQFKSGLFDGQGFYDVNGSRYSGEFIKGEFTGMGSYLESGELVYSGGFKNWFFEGEGQFFSTSGEQWKGTFEGGDLKADGEYTNSEGDRYVGPMKNWQAHGVGVLYYENGDRYEGKFRYGRRHGHGVMFLAEPEHGVSEYQGRWRYGDLVESDPPTFTDQSAEKLELAIYSEAERLQQQLSQMQEQTPGKTDLYYLGIAGDGSQRVFGREVDTVTEKIHARYQNEDKTILLVNDRTRIGNVVMATTYSVDKAVQAIAAKMDKSEDILLVYMTSHGSEDHEFVLKQKGLSIPDLPAKSLAQILQNSGITWQIVMVSACYSGGFIPLLESETRMLMASAAADKTSFGCSDDSDMTYFGRAFFEKAFTADAEWPAMFAQAKDWIAQQEQEEALTPSNPQLFVGKRMLQKLAELDEDLTP